MSTAALERETIDAVSTDDVFSLIANGGRNPDDPARWHAMLLSYLDDSSDSFHQDYFAVGGLVGGEKQWSDFHVPWAVATLNLKEPFHATDCETQHGQFEGWSIPESNALMDKLVSIVLNQQLHGYASVVPIGSYRAVFPDSGEYDPYYLAVRHAIINMGELVNRVQRTENIGGLKCWFEDSDATTGKTFEIYRALRSFRPWKASAALAPNPEFEPKTLRPLQAADLIAREAYKHFINLATKCPKRPTRIPVDRMRDSLNFHLWNLPSLEYLRDNGGSDNLDLLTSWESPSPRRTKPPKFDRFWGNDFPPRHS